MQNQQSKLEQLLKENAIGADEFAYCLGLEPGQAAALILGQKRLTPKLARQIEQTFSKPKHWLDDEDQSGSAGYDLFG